MIDKTDEIMKNYFSDRHPPSPETKALLHEKLLIASQRQETRWIWVVLLYAALFSGAIICALWIFIAHRVIVFACATYLLLSLISGVIIIIACLSRQTKGGDENVIVLD